MLTITNKNEHKKVHKSQSNLLHHLITPKVVSEPDPDTGLYNPFPTFPYTGSLRPVYPLTPRREVPAHIQKPDYWETGVPKSEQTFAAKHKITVLNAKEIEAMRLVCRYTREVLDIAAREVKPGVTTDYLDEVVHKASIERSVRFMFFRVI
jgi:methionyl aminopeptidase